MDSNIKREIILDNYNNPYKRGLLNDESYTLLVANNESCIDKFDIEILMDNDIIVDMHFDGEGCAISTSSTSLLMKLLIGKTKKEALDIINNYENMINELPYDEKILDEANCMDEIYKQANRKKCALISFVTVKDELLK